MSLSLKASLVRKRIHLHLLYNLYANVWTPYIGQADMQRLFNQGAFMEFFQLWDEHLAEEIKQNTASQKLEFKLNVYFAVYPLLHRSNLGNQVCKLV